MINKFENCTREWIKLYTAEKSGSENTSEEDLKRQLDIVDSIAFNENNNAVSEVSRSRVLRKSSTHSDLDSFVSANSRIVVDEKELEFAYAKTYEEIDFIRSKIVQQMHMKYTSFDRYIRCPTTYHRAKVIVKNGAEDKIVWN
eukprot:NODE_536_length_7014_cov_0.311208.p5 type:complete len:143 gc:universal NODE_536_length_7014_cov_0.311208:1475-1047(-)